MFELSMFALMTLILNGEDASPKNADETLEVESGVLELEYEPKHCLIDPCPQFVAVKRDGKAIERVAVDVINLDLQKSAITAFRRPVAQGTWTKEKSHWRMTVTEWSKTIGEVIEPKQREKKESE